jgi:uncharacterized protein (UPF0335 family)
MKRRKPSSSDRPRVSVPKPDNDGKYRVTTRSGAVQVFDTAVEAVQAVREAIATKFAGDRRDRVLNKGEQRDIEDADQAGVHPKQREKEAEVGGIAADRLRSIIERVERLEDEKKALSSDIKDVMAEAKSAGFDVKVIRQILRIRKQEPADVEEQETLLDLYRRALGI